MKNVTMLGVSLGARPLQGRDGMQFPRNATPDNAVLQPIAFVNRSLTRMETSYSSMEREVLGILHGLENFTATVTHLQSKHDYRSQDTVSNIQERCCKPITEDSEYF